jgi:hypothetical protein
MATAGPTRGVDRRDGRGLRTLAIARHGDDAMAAQSGRDTEARKVRRKVPPGPGVPTPPERSRTTEPSEDFAERRDIETADEPKEQHDRRHHARDVESVPPA